MKFTRITAFAVLSASLLIVPLHAAESAALADMDFANITPPSSGQVVEVDLHSPLLNIVAKMASEKEPDAAELIRGLKHIKVNVVKIDDGNRAAALERINSIRAKLDASGWERVVKVREEKGDNVCVHMKLRGEEAIEGIVVTVMNDNKEAVIVNVIGDIRPEQVAKIGAKYDIEPLKHLKIKTQS